jgi:hypothetical protein
LKAATVVFNGGIMAAPLDRELAKPRQGDHLCPIHDNLVEQTASAVAFIAADLRSGERRLDVANDSPFEQLVVDAGYKPNNSYRINGRELR